MSGIYISGMEVPKEAGTYRIEFDQCGNPYLLSENGDLGLWHIISVPDHGRLGDLDELKAKGYALSALRIEKDKEGRLKGWRELVSFDEAPTIIPADPPEEDRNVT